MTCVLGPDGKCAYCHMGRMMMTSLQRRLTWMNTSRFIFHHKEYKTFKHSFMMRESANSSINLKPELSVSCMLGK